MYVLGDVCYLCFLEQHKILSVNTCTVTLRGCSFLGVNCATLSQHYSTRGVMDYFSGHTQMFILFSRQCKCSSILLHMLVLRLWIGSCVTESNINFENKFLHFIVETSFLERQMILGSSAGMGEERARKTCSKGLPVRIEPRLLWWKVKSFVHASHTLPGELTGYLSLYKLLKRTGKWGLHLFTEESASRQWGLTDQLHKGHLRYWYRQLLNGWCIEIRQYVTLFKLIYSWPQTH